MSSQIGNLSVAQLRKAITIKERLAKLEKKLAAILGTTGAVPVEGTTRRKNKMSAAGRASIAAAQRARWAKLKAGKGDSSAEPAKKKKRKMSAAGRRAIAEGARKRWAKVNAEKAKK